jgi:hypothetical protein
MEQRTMIYGAWARAGGQAAARSAASASLMAAAAVEETPEVSTAARAFMDMMRDSPDVCWEDMVPEFRAHYYDALEELIPPLLALDDPLITLNLVRFADPNRPREAALLRQVVEQSDPERHQHSLRAIAEMKRPELLAAIQRKRGLPSSVTEVLGPPPVPPAASSKPAAAPRARTSTRGRKPG